MELSYQFELKELREFHNNVRELIEDGEVNYIPEYNYKGHRHYNKMPSYLEMLFSNHKLVLESFFSSKDIAELLGV